MKTSASHCGSLFLSGILLTTDHGFDRNLAVSVHIFFFVDVVLRSSTRILVVAIVDPLWPSLLNWHYLSSPYHLMYLHWTGLGNFQPDKALSEKVTFHVLGNRLSTLFFLSFIIEIILKWKVSIYMFCVKLSIYMLCVKCQAYFLQQNIICYYFLYAVCVLLGQLLVLHYLELSIQSYLFEVQKHIFHPSIWSTLLWFNHVPIYWF